MIRYICAERGALRPNQEDIEKGHILIVRSIEISERNEDNVLVSGINPTISPTVVKSFE